MRTLLGALPTSNHGRRDLARLALLVISGLLLSRSYAASPAEGNPAQLEEKVVRASLATYFHGMTEEVALQEVGREGLPIIRRLLSDPSFPRRDNLVAFLDALGGAEDRDALLSFLRRPPASIQKPEEERALLLSPQALGKIARRGDAGALGALLSMTAHRSQGDVLQRSAAQSAFPPLLRDDLLEMALKGLALSGAPAGRDRLVGIAASRIMPAPGGRNLQRQAGEAIALFDQLETGTIDAPCGKGSRKLDEAEDAGTTTSVSSTTLAAVAGTLDAQSRVNRAGLTYANHVSVTSPMSDDRLDDVLSEASVRAGRGDFAEDVACCSTVARSGSGMTFGTSTDGLDIIDTSAELSSVLNNPAGRFKVVRSINYCGATGTNIIGCGWKPGNGIAVVRMSGLSSEAILWLHEYGHNTGLSHNTTASRFMMYGVDYGTNDGLSQSECDAYHAPSASAAMTSADIGACTDADADLVHALVDNCPSVANPDQADANLDGTGDACPVSIPPVCGNGLRETGEVCDGSDLGARTCVSLGYAGGILACAPQCTLDTSRCITNLCGNGARDTGEACDGTDLGGQTCTTLRFDAGTLVCSASCAIDSSGCYCVDADHDGVARCDGDCNDNNPTIFPGAPEICNDGIDQDCNGADKTRKCVTAAENCHNGVDDDRDGFVDCADPNCSRSKYCR